jgi:hypothetical protein
MVLVTSSMAEEACKPTLAESSEADATWLEALATCEGSVADAAHQTGQAFYHAGEGVAQSVVRGAGLHFHGQVAAGQRLGNCGHFLQVRNHLGERAGQFADFVVLFEFDGVLEVSGVADQPRDFHQVGKRFRDRAGGTEGDNDAQA